MIISLREQKCVGIMEAKRANQNIDGKTFDLIVNVDATREIRKYSRINNWLKNQDVCGKRLNFLFSIFFQLIAT